MILECEWPSNPNWWVLLTIFYMVGLETKSEVSIQVTSRVYIIFIDSMRMPAVELLYNVWEKG